jgi:mannose-6-phosphate isomerase-like protein (cupin superfamily)
MISRRQFVGQGSVGVLASFMLPLFAYCKTTSDFEGLVVTEEEGEAYRLRDGRASVKIKISKQQGATSISLLASVVATNDAILVHKHMNEDEFIFIRQGSGIFTLGEKEHAVKSGSVILIPKGVWHGLKNTGKEDIGLFFGYSPAGFEGFFREVGSPVGQPFVEKTIEQRKAIAKKWGMIIKD